MEHFRENGSPDLEIIIVVHIGTGEIAEIFHSQSSLVRLYEDNIEFCLMKMMRDTKAELLSLELVNTNYMIPDQKLIVTQSYGAMSFPRFVRIANTYFESSMSAPLLDARA